MGSEARVPYDKFHEITELEFDDCKEVVVSLGCEDFAARDIPKHATGFAVHLAPILNNDRILGTGAYAGFVYRLDEDILNQLWTVVNESFTQDELYLSAGANVGDYEDSDHEGAPVCSDCFLAGSSLEELESLTPIPDSKHACWSCVQMIDEGMREAGRCQEFG